MSAVLTPRSWQHVRDHVAPRTHGGTEPEAEDGERVRAVAGPPDLPDPGLGAAEGLHAGDGAGMLNPKDATTQRACVRGTEGDFGTVVQDELLERNPCREPMRRPVRHVGEPASLGELALLVAAMPERLRLTIELAAWCALRFGEVAEFRRGDVDLKNAVIRVTRAAQWVDGTKIVAAPKADSVRVVAFPPHIAEAIRDHLKNHTQWSRDGLLSGCRRIGWTCPRRRAAGSAAGLLGGSAPGSPGRSRCGSRRLRRRLVIGLPGSRPPIW
jgi:hypothetical protein